MILIEMGNTVPSVTDWIQAVGVVFAVIGLLVNFYYQRKALYEQSQIRFLEEERDRRSIMPYFELETKYNQEHNDFTLTFKCIDQPGKLFFVSPILQEMNEYNIVIMDFKPGESYELSIPKSIIDKYSPQLGTDREFFKVSYMDKESRPYTQKVYLVIYQIYITDPIQHFHIMMLEEYNRKRSKSIFKIFQRKQKSKS